VLGWYERQSKNRPQNIAEAELESLLSRRFDGLKLLIVYIDGIVFGEHTMVGAVGVDAAGRKHVLGIREGATENGKRKSKPPWGLAMGGRTCAGRRCGSNRPGSFRAGTAPWCRMGATPAYRAQEWKSSP
jgi:hypothetical protein